MVLLVERAVALVDLLALGVADDDGAEGGLELLIESDRDLARRCCDGAAGRRGGAHDVGMRERRGRCRQAHYCACGKQDDVTLSCHGKPPGFAGLRVTPLDHLQRGTGVIMLRHLPFGDWDFSILVTVNWPLTCSASNFTLSPALTALSIAASCALKTMVMPCSMPSFLIGPCLRVILPAD